MSLFDNAERRVQNHKSGIENKYDKFGRKIINIPEKKEIVEEQVTAKIIQGPETQKPELSEGEKHYREVQVQNNINKNSKANYLQQLSDNTKVGVLENVLTSIYYDALFLDDDFKEHNAVVIQEAVHDYLVDKGGYNYIVEAYNRTKSPLIKAIMDICEETSKEVNKKEIKKMNEDMSYTFGKLFKFKLEEEEKQKLDYNKESIGLKQISSTIKDKILDVVKEEKKRETEHAEMMDEIENQLSDDPEVNDAEAVAEALNKIFINNVNIEEGTLFNSLLRTNYKRVLESGYDALELERMNVDADISDILNKVTLESVLLDNEFKDTRNLSNDDIKCIFDDFVNNVTIQENPSLDDVVESFANVQNRFTDLANEAINKQELYQLRNDFRILQETFEEVINNMIITEEGKKCTGKECAGVDKKNLTVVNDNDDDVAKDAKKDPKNKETKNEDKIDTTFDQEVLRGNKKKVVKECIVQILEECVNTIDEKLQMHENADEFARNTVLENYMGENVLIPIIKKADMQLDGLKLAYKMKHVLESLTVLVNDYEGADNTALIKNAVETNKANARFVLESFKGIPSTPVYKINFFNTFNDLLQVVDENVNELCALYENFDIKEIDYDDVNGDLLIDDEYNTFRILTECADDNHINGDVEYIDMDFILANTIMKYTLLETMYTLQLEDFKHNDIKKITNNMLNK